MIGTSCWSIRTRFTRKSRSGTRASPRFKSQRYSHRLSSKNAASCSLSRAQPIMKTGFRMAFVYSTRVVTLK